MKRIFLLSGLLSITFLLFTSVSVSFANWYCENSEIAKKLPALRISDNGHFIIDENGKPFFWLGDTGWQLFEKVSREDAELYLEKRKEQGFTVIQAVAIMGSDDTKEVKPNIYGNKPFRINSQGKFEVIEAYFKHVDFVINKAEEAGLYIALLPIWSDHFVRKDTGIFNSTNTKEAFEYGLFLGKRYGDKPIIWTLGGDHFDEGATEVWRQLAKGLKQGDGGRNLITYHPRGYKQSSTELHDEDWLDLNMIQTGHMKHNTGYLLTAKDYALTPAKPTIIGEAGYEGISDRLRKGPVKLDDTDVRRYAYVDVFTGAAETTYGCNEVFQFWSEGRVQYCDRFPAQMDWKEALDRPGAGQMQYLRKLIESRPMLNRIPDQSMIVGDPLYTLNRIQATRDSEGNYAFVYISSGASVVIDLNKMCREFVKASWYNPRNGETIYIGEYSNRSRKRFLPPTTGVGNDWVLVLDAVPFDQSSTHGSDHMYAEWKEMNASKDTDYIKYNEAKFGMFIHFGAYSQLGGIWKGEEIPRLGEWIMYHAQIPRNEYKDVCRQFNPKGFNAEEWVKLAKEAGMKYMVAMCKHHDGFSIYNSDVTDFNIYDYTSFKRDPIEELYNACKKHGLRLGLYYSHSIDWMDGGDAGYAQKMAEDSNHKDNYGANLWDPAPVTYEQYIETKAKPQMREILTKFPDLIELWYDFPRFMNREQSFDFYKLAYSYQPNCLVNSRVGNYFGDYKTAGDNQIPTTVNPDYRTWETPGTLNNTWGYKSYDQDWKSYEELLYWIVEIASKGGNYLLNVGPDGNGLIPDQSVKILKEIGKWMKVNGEAIYGTDKCVIKREGPTTLEMKSTTHRAKHGFNLKFTHEDFWFTTKGNNVYAISLTNPDEHKVSITFRQFNCYIIFTWGPIQILFGT